MKRGLFAGIVLLFTACGAAPRPRPTLTPNELLARSVPVIVWVIGDKQGVGAVVTPDGLVAVAEHIVEDQQLRVKVQTDPADHPVKLVALDKTHGLALIQIVSASGMAVAALGDSGRVAAGDQVYEVNPDGASAGTITNVRQLSGDLTIFEISTSNPGAWYGPIYDVHGDIVAFTEATVPIGNSRRTVVAVPASYVRAMLKQQGR